jgi:ParB family chromosome partitioning protein
MLEEGRMDMGHARALLALQGARQSQIARQVVDRHLSVRETEQLVRRLLEKPVAGKGRRRALDPDIRVYQEKLSGKLGAKVSIQHGARGKGRLVIEYASLDQLEGIVGRIR